MYVDLHARKRVNQGNGVASRRLGCLCHFRNIRHVRRKLHDYRLLCLCLNFFRNLRQTLWVLSERNSPVLYIRAGNINFQQINRLVGKLFHNLHIICRRTSAYIDDDFRVKLLQKRNIPLNKHVNPRILQPDCV